MASLLVVIRGLRGSRQYRLARRTKYSAMTSCAQHTTNMARRARCLVVDSVRTILGVTVVGHAADNTTEDPSEFFTMIFGGEAFVDW